MLITATAIEEAMAVVIPNVEDSAALGVEIVNPWVS